MSHEFYTSSDGWVYETYEDDELEDDNYEYSYDTDDDFEINDDAVHYIDTTPQRRIVLATNVEDTILRAKQGKVKIRKKRLKPTIQPSSK